MATKKTAAKKTTAKKTAAPRRDGVHQGRRFSRC